MKKGNWDNYKLITKPDFKQSMERIEAWYSMNIIDRAPVRFHRHNAQFDHESSANKEWSTLKERWFDTEYQVESFINSLKGKTFRGETFPIFDPNLGPDILQAFYGQELDFGEITSWTQPKIDCVEDLFKIELNYESPYFKKIEVR